MPINAIPNQVNDPSTKLDVGDYLVGCEEIKEEYTNDDNRLFYTGKFRVAQPPSHAGQLHYERFYIGTDEDPGGMNAETWTNNGGRLKKCCEAAQVPFTGQNPTVILQQMFGKQLCMKIIHRPYKDKKTNEDRIGANVQAWGQAGSMTPHVQAVEGNSGQPVGAPTAASTPAPLAAQTPGQGSGMPPTQPQPATTEPPSPLPPGTPRY